MDMVEPEKEAVAIEEEDQNEEKKTEKKKKRGRPKKAEIGIAMMADETAMDDDYNGSDRAAGVVGRAVRGVVEACVGPDSFLITIRVHGTDLVYRGVAFGPGAVGAPDEPDDKAAAAYDDDDDDDSQPSITPLRLASPPCPITKSSPSSAFTHLTTAPFSATPPTERSIDPAASSVHYFRPTAFRSPTPFDQEMLRFMYPGGLPELRPPLYTNGGSFFVPRQPFLPPPHPDNSDSAG